MQTRLVGKVFGRTFAVVMPEQVVELVLPRLPFGWEATDQEPELTWYVTPGDLDSHYTVHKGGEPVVENRPWAAVPMDVGGSVELWAAEHAEGLIVIHGGAVAWKGVAIALPGYTLTGKSMLVRELLAQGASYLSDEYVPLRSDGLVVPYPRPVSVRPNGDGLSHLLPLVDLGCEVVVEPLPLGMVADLRYDPGAGLALIPMTRAETVLALLRHCVPAQTRTVEALDHIQAALAGCVAVTGTRAEAADAVPELLARLS